MEKEKEEKNLIKLVFSNVFGIYYFVSSIVMIIICMVFSILIGVTKLPGFVWTFIGLSLLYCFLILVGEIIRVQINRSRSKKASEEKEEK